MANKEQQTGTKNLSFFDEYSEILSGASRQQLTQERGTMMDSNGAFNGIFVLGGLITGVSLGVNRYIESRSKDEGLDKVLKVGTRTGVTLGVVLTGVGLVGHLMTRKALNMVMKEMRGRSYTRY